MLRDDCRLFGDGPRLETGKYMRPGNASLRENSVGDLSLATHRFTANPPFHPQVLQGTCPVCGKAATFEGFTDNVRESGTCSVCHSFNRQRQMAYVLRKRLGISLGAEWSAPAGFTLYNTETTGAVHQALSGKLTYVASEFFGPEHEPGATVDGRRHENLQSLSFGNGSFDVVLSSDVLEHMPDPYRAHREIWRTLRPGGCHIFTVPFSQALERDDVRAVMKGGQPQLLAPALYHGDPVRPDEGILVWTIFGMEMLSRLEQIGFDLVVHNIHAPELGIVGDWPIVFQATKPSGSMRRMVAFVRRRFA